MPTLDPFSAVYEALWELAEGSPPLTALVKPGNRIKFNKTRVADPVKKEVSDADLPELTLICTTSVVNMMDSSSSTKVVKNYDWIIATGDLNLLRKLMPVEWYLVCAMLRYPAVLNALQWEGQSYVKVCRVTGVSAGLTDSERNRGIVGFSSIWSLEKPPRYPSSSI